MSLNIISDNTFNLFLCSEAFYLLDGKLVDFKECVPYLSQQVVSGLTSLEQSANMTKSELFLTISNTKKEVKWYSTLFWSEKEIVEESLVKKDSKSEFRIVYRVESFLREI